jgi:hypothetical protein
VTRVLAVTRHAGVSFNGRSGQVHLRIANEDSRVLSSTWDALIRSVGLGGPLLLTRGRNQTSSASAELFHFLPLDTLRAALDHGLVRRELPRWLTDELATAASDARMYAASYGRHVTEAARRGWLVHPLRLGFHPALLLGAGRHARMLVMNAPEVAPGALAGSAAAAVRAARRLGDGRPVVLKRMSGGNSDGVIVGLERPADVRSAATRLLAGHHAVLVEAMVEGNEYRLHFIDGRLHRMFHAEPYTITGDGRRSIAALLRRAHPRYLRAMSAAEAHRRRLVLCLWSAGVREFADLGRIVPARGKVLRASPASGTGMRRVAPSSVLLADDIARLERFLARYRAPSCGLDLVMRAPRAPLDEAGAILEINVPCGFAYLDQPARAVAADLDAAVADDPDFRRTKGRIPVWLVLEEDAPRLRPRALALLRSRHGRVRVGRLADRRDDGRDDWASLLNDATADALLLTVSEAAVEAHGLPRNLGATLVHDATAQDVTRRAPMTCRTVRHAAGRVQRLPR